MKTITFLLMLLPALATAQLQNLPAGFVLKTYPGNPLVIQFTVGGSDPMPAPITAVFKYGAALKDFPPESQPTVTTTGRVVAVKWNALPVQPGTYYVAVSLGQGVQIGGTLSSSYINSPPTLPAVLTVNPTALIPINLTFTYPPGSVAPVADLPVTALSIWQQLMALLFN